MRTILLDCDGILSDFVGAALAIVKDVTGRDHTHADVTAFDIWGSLGLSAAEASTCKRAIGDTNGIARELFILPGALDGFRMLRDTGADIYIVTSPWNSNPTWTHDREYWLKHLFQVPHSNVVHTSAKHLVRGDMLVDDRADTCARWREAHPHGIAVHWETPHNRREAWDGISTCDWSRLAKIAEEM